MTETEIYDGVIVEGTKDIAAVVDILQSRGVGWCVIGGLAVNAYTAPVYTRDLDLAVVAADLSLILDDLRAANFQVKEFPFSVNAQRRFIPADNTHRLVVQFTKLDRYQSFVSRAQQREIFGILMPVASLDDVVQGKIWAWSDSTRRASKHAKDESDLLRLGESHPRVRKSLPRALQEILERQDLAGGQFLEEDNLKD